MAGAELGVKPPETLLSKVGEERLAWDDAARLERLQWTVARAQLTPFGKDRMGKVHVTSLADLKELPFLHKEDLKANPPWVFLAGSKDDAWHFHESFGTTGRPVCSWYSLNDLEAELDIIPHWIQEFAPGRVVMNRYPYAFSVPAQLVEAAVRLKGGVLIPTSHLTYNVGTSRVLGLIDRLQVNVMSALPLEPVLLRETALLQGRDPKTAFPSFESFSLAGRILTPTWKRSIEESWNVTVNNLFGCTEAGPFATSDSQGRLRLHEHAFLFEILDPETKEPVTEAGGTGVLVATSLTREAQPMVRYWTQDLVRVLEHPHDGLGQPIEVIGRSGGGLRYAGVEVNNFDLEEEILQWSWEFGANVFFVVVTHRGLIVRIEAPEPGAVNSAEGERRLSSRLGVPVRVEIVPRGVLVNHVSLLASAAVFKPRTVSDHRVDKRRVINLSGGLIDFWAEMTPTLMALFVKKWFKDKGTSWRLRLLG